MSTPAPTPPVTQAPSFSSPVSILSVLVEQGVLTKEQVAALPAMADNATAEQYLQANHLVNEEQLLQAYAMAYQIPFVRLAGRKIKPEILRLIPELVARRYDVAAYDQRDGLVYVAIASPRRFKANQSVGLLRQLQTELGFKIAPALAPLQDIRNSFVGYEQQAPVTGEPKKQEAATHPFPSISLIDRSIVPAVLQRFPESVARHYGFVVFDEPQANQLHVAAIDPAGKATQQVLQYLIKQHGVSVVLYQTDQASLQTALAGYSKNGETVPAAPTSHPIESALQQSALQSTASQVPAQSMSEVQVPTAAQKLTAEPTPAASTTKTTPPPAQVAEVTTEQLMVPVSELTGQAKPAANQSGKPPVNTHKPNNEANLDDFLGIPMQSVQELAELVRSGNVPRMVAGIVSLAVGMRASDIHIEAEKDKIRLRYRIDGELVEVLLVPRVLLAPLVSRIKILSQLKIDENRVPQDGRFGVVVRKREIDLRVSTLPTVFGEKVVIRILDKTTGIMSLEDMGMDGHNLKVILENIEKPYGIVLSTGPTGSGKSTTLYAILQRISNTTNNVITLEDPVEYEMDGVNQTQIKPKIGFTFAEGLRSILRQDPNIIMVGEIRDKETAEMATHAALTGHLVLSTLHTNSAAGALPRMINMGIEPFLITSSINAVEAQRLVRRVCDKCKQQEELPQGVLDELLAELKNSNVEPQFKDPANWRFFRGKGCSECNNGYRGRIGIFEVMPMSEAVEALAVKKEPATVIEQQAVKEGMITMKQDGLIKALRGLTTVEEVMKATTE